MADSLTRYGAVVRAALRAPAGRRWPSARRVVVMLGFLPLFTLVQVGHWVALLLDEVLFPGYRRVPVRAPLFVLGVPRSGTTLLHRVLSRDPNLTTFRTWECLLAPSITQRMVIRGLARVDRAVGRPCGRLLAALERGVFGTLDDVHAMDLSAPEEDYLALLPAMACFILVVPFPAAAPLWRLGTADRDMPAGERDRLMAFYRGLLQRHLYVHGADRRLLSKNAAFAGLAGSLATTFPDGMFIRCDRDARAVVPSQLSAIQGGVRLFASDPENQVFTPRMTELLRFYYANLARTLPAGGGPRHVTLDMNSLKEDLAGTVQGVYRTLDLPLDPTFADALAEEAAAARAYRSRHRYTANAFGLDETAIAATFAPVQDRNGPASGTQSPDRGADAPHHPTGRRGAAPAPSALAGQQGS
ncbi:sulfotransferase [Roseospira goensis]|uniref:Sulfotransferase n=1 Tax=Roseospira goensis TaxID=391922 RepID=A0A7W6WJJ6_9PROT|nr:sulfotransferase [Roseospira goensis]MBB4284744.1 hypothetical protein [Roseospira goensis]